MKGPVSKLIRVKDMSTATALEVTAGGKVSLIADSSVSIESPQVIYKYLCVQLYNVVVDTEETGKQLLQKGKLKRRYTIIPLKQDHSSDHQ